MFFIYFWKFCALFATLILDVAISSKQQKLEEVWWMNGCFLLIDKAFTA
jgi:hypothetical protein